jgi:hypothetical protein
MDTRQVVARFEVERQALALMDHSHIAKVLDAGAALLKLNQSKRCHGSGHAVCHPIRVAYQNGRCEDIGPVG